MTILEVWLLNMQCDRLCFLQQAELIMGVGTGPKLWQLWAIHSIAVSQSC